MEKDAVSASGSEYAELCIGRGAICTNRSANMMY